MTTVITPDGPIPIPYTQDAPPTDDQGWPTSLPIIDTATRIIGRGAVETWNDIYDWIDSTWQSAGSVVDFLSDETVQVVFPVMQALAGQIVKGLGSTINDLTSFVLVGKFLTDNILGQAFGFLNDINTTFGHALVTVFGAVESILDGYLPALYDAIINMPAWVLDQIGNITLDIETWAIGHILNPVLDELLQVEAGIRADVFSLVDAVGGTLADMINAVDTDLLARLGLVAGVAAAALTFVEGCGKSMCDLFGPATDIGKLFKAFELAGILSLLMEIGDMTEADVVARLRELAGDVSGVVNTFDDVFVGGGGSLLDFGKALL